MKRLREMLERTPPLERAGTVRHGALLLATIAAYCLRQNIALSRQVLWVFGLAALLNLGGACLANFTRAERLARWSSAVIGIGGWSTLIGLTGGVDSPFVAGLWLEVLVAATVFCGRDLLFVAALAISGLWLQEALQGGSLTRPALSIQTAFIVAMAGAASCVVRRWTTQQRGASQALCDRLEGLQSEIDAARALSRIGEKTARSAHQFKSMLHALRGLMKLLENPSLSPELRKESLAAVSFSIDRLEEVVRELLRSGARVGNAKGQTTAGELLRLLDEVKREVGTAHLSVRWLLSASVDLPDIAIPVAALRQIATTLLENAAQATPAGGTVALELQSAKGALELSVEDDGLGLVSISTQELFTWGATTKASGNGAGLFLSKRLVESFGGRIDATPRDRGGMRFAVTFPVSSPHAADPPS